MLLTFSDWKSAEISIWDTNGNRMNDEVGHIEIRFPGRETTNEYSLEVEVLSGALYHSYLSVKSVCESKYDTKKEG